MYDGTTWKLTTALEDSVELAMDQYIRIATDRGSEVRVERDVKSIMTVLRDIQHAGAEILRTWGRLLEEELKDETSSGVLDTFKGLHEGGNGRRVDLVAKARSTLDEGVLGTGQRQHCSARMQLLTRRRSMGASCLRSRACSEKCTATCCATAMLVMSMNCQDPEFSICTAEYCQGSYLLDQVVGLGPLVLATVNGHAVVIQLEGQAKRVCLDTTILEAARAELRCDVVQNLDVVRNTRGIVLWNDRDIPQRLAVYNVLRFGVRELRRGPASMSDYPRTGIDRRTITHLMMVLPNHFLTTLASFVIVKMTEKVRRS